jgi:hypothetical protein
MYLRFSIFSYKIAISSLATRGSWRLLVVSKASCIRVSLYFFLSTCISLLIFADLIVRVIAGNTRQFSPVGNSSCTSPQSMQTFSTTRPPHSPHGIPIFQRYEPQLGPFFLENCQLRLVVYDNFPVRFGSPRPGFKAFLENGVAAV